MKKMFLIALLMSTQFGSFLAKSDQNSKLKVSLICKRTEDLITNPEYTESFEYIVNYLDKMAKKSKNQLLTFEEILTIYKMIMFLYLQDNDDYSKYIEIVLGNGEKFKIPYSHDILEGLMIDQNNANQSA